MRGEAALTMFFGYPSHPRSISEAIQTAAQEIIQGGVAVAKTWEEMKSIGTVLIQEICHEIDDCSIFCADLTGLNPNVLFELGYAIGKDKRIWPVIDLSLTQSKRDFEQLQTLTTLGYTEYSNSEQIVRAFYRMISRESSENTLFQSAIAPNIRPGVQDHILYLRGRHETNADIRITKAIGACAIPQIIDDPKESASQTLTWYGVQVYSAHCVVCHMANSERDGSGLHNAKYSLVAGLALGLNKPLLMLSEGNYTAPVDYRDILKQYETASQAAKYIEEWLTPLEESWRNKQDSIQNYSSTTRLASELKGIRLGEPVAENEALDLVDHYFIETHAFREALEGKHTIASSRIEIRPAQSRVRD